MTTWTNSQIEQVILKNINFKMEKVLCCFFLLFIYFCVCVLSVFFLCVLRVLFFSSSGLSIFVMWWIMRAESYQALYFDSLTKLLAILCIRV